jgi:DNA-binding transcriptional MerR regulator
VPRKEYYVDISVINRKNMKHTSLGEIAIKLGINKSKLAYYFSMGLLKPIAQVGRMHVFDEQETIKIIKKIDSLKKSGKTLDEIKVKI